MGSVREAKAERVRARILDAASICMVQGGLGSDRLLSAIAREAGISRPTLYRHFDRFDAVREALIQRELSQLVEQVLPMLDELAWNVDSLVDLIAYVVSYARQHPLFAAALRDIPEQLLPQLTTEAFVPVRYALSMLEPRLQDLVDTGALPPVDVHFAGDLLARIALSFAFTNTTVTIDDADELRVYLRKAISLFTQIHTPG